MMQVKVIETGDVKTLRLIDPDSGVDFVQDFVGNGGGFENKDFVYNHEDDVFEATAQAFSWWNQVISDQQELVDRISELKEEHGSDAVNEVLESVGGHDLEDDAAVVNAALDEAFGEEDEQVEAQAAGATWMETVLTECENPDEWLGLNYQEFMQAAANANRPAFPAFESGEELDAAYQGAWDQLEFSRKLFAEDAIYQEDLEKRKMEGWKDPGFKPV